MVYTTKFGAIVPLAAVLNPAKFKVAEPVECDTCTRDHCYHCPVDSQQDTHIAA